MLVYHTDPHIDGILGTVKMNLFLIDKDLTAGRLIESAEHIHHGTLSGSILSQDRMYLSFVHGQIDVVVGCKVAEFLHDVLHLNDYFTRIHMACSCQGLFPPVCFSRTDEEKVNVCSAAAYFFSCALLDHGYVFKSFFFHDIRQMY